MWSFTRCGSWRASALYRPPAPRVAAPAQRRAASSARPAAPSAPPCTPARPPGFVQTPVLAVVRRSAGHPHVPIRPPRWLRFQGRPVPDDSCSRRRPRTWSAATRSVLPRRRRGYLEISVKRQGLVSNTLHSTLRPASTRLGSRPGRRVLLSRRSTTGRSCSWQAGSASRRSLSMLRHAVATEPTRPVTLLYSARNEESLAFRHETARSLPRAIRRRRSSWPRRARRRRACIRVASTKALIRATLPDFRRRGRDALRPATHDRRHARDAARPRRAGRSGAFGTSSKPRSPRQAAKAAEARSRSARHGTHKMPCTRAGQAVQVAAGQSILEAAEAGRRADRFPVPRRRLRHVPHESHRGRRRLRVRGARRR